MCAGVCGRHSLEEADASKAGVSRAGLFQEDALFLHSGCAKMVDLPHAAHLFQMKPGSPCMHGDLSQVSSASSGETPFIEEAQRLNGLSRACHVARIELAEHVVYGCSSKHQLRATLMKSVCSM